MADDRHTCSSKSSTPVLPPTTRDPGPRPCAVCYYILVPLHAKCVEKGRGAWTRMCPTPDARPRDGQRATAGDREPAGLARASGESLPVEYRHTAHRLTVIHYCSFSIQSTTTCVSLKTQNSSKSVFL